MGLPEELVAQHVRRYLNPLYRPQPLPGLDSTAAVHPPGTPGTHWRTASMWDDVLASLATVLVSSGSSVPARPWRTLTRLWLHVRLPAMQPCRSYAACFSCPCRPYAHIQKMVAFDVPRDAGLEGKFAFRWCRYALPRKRPEPLSPHIPTC